MQIFRDDPSQNHLPFLILALVYMIIACDDPGRIKVRRMNKGQNLAIEDSRLTFNSNHIMGRGRPRIYKTPEEKAAANRAKSMRSYYKYVPYDILCALCHS